MQGHKHGLAGHSVVFTTLVHHLAVSCRLEGWRRLLAQSAWHSGSQLGIAAVMGLVEDDGRGHSCQPLQDVDSGQDGTHTKMKA